MCQIFKTQVCIVLLSHSKNLLAFAGYDVTKEYYINDAGGQVDTLARSAHLRYREALGEAISIPEGFYPGDYLVPVGAALAAEFGDAYVNAPESEWLVNFRTRTVALMMAPSEAACLAGAGVVYLGVST